ncbi:hypothetical protein PENSPDRAFT_691040 [Peniophora sp. CONT]|nr:hypothetical protein PENSPDRAFT_691040 [Peniophora sp. CONT]
MRLGVLIWIQPLSEVGQLGDDRICATLEFFTKKRLREMWEAGDIDNDDDIGHDFEDAPDYTAWLSNCEGFYKSSDILTVPSVQETRIHVRFAPFTRYLNVDEPACIYRLDSTSHND